MNRETDVNMIFRKLVKEIIDVIKSCAYLKPIINLNVLFKFTTAPNTG